MFFCSDLQVLNVDYQIRDPKVTAWLSLVAFAVTAMKGHPGGENLTLCRFENHTLKEAGFSFWIVPVTKQICQNYIHIFFNFTLTYKHLVNYNR